MSVFHTMTPGRRPLLKGLLGTALAIPAINRAYAREELYVNSWGGPWEVAAREHLFEPFTRDTGIEIKTVSPVSLAKLNAQVRTGVYEFDVTTLGDADIVQANAQGLLDQNQLDPKTLWDGAVFQNGIGSHAFATVISYRKDVVTGDAPQSWTDFWDVKRFPGSRCLQRHAGRVIALALLADGVKPEDLYPMDLDRAFASLDKIKPHIRVWWAQGPQSRQLLRDREVDLIGIWQTYPVQLIKEGLPIALNWNQALLDKGYWVVAKGSPRRDAAWKFVQSAVRPERVAAFARANFYGPLNPRAYDHISAEDAALMPTSPVNIGKVVVQDTAKAGPQLQEAARRFERWIGR